MRLNFHSYELGEHFCETWNRFILSEQLRQYGELKMCCFWLTMYAFTL